MGCRWPTPSRSLWCAVVAAACSSAPPQPSRISDDASSARQPLTDARASTDTPVDGHVSIDEPSADAPNSVDSMDDAGDPCGELARCCAAASFPIYSRDACHNTVMGDVPAGCAGAL